VLQKKGTFYVSTLIIPKQEATSDSCQTVNEEEIFDTQDQRGLFQLGWIHVSKSAVYVGGVVLDCKMFLLSSEPFVGAVSSVLRNCWYCFLFDKID
jgi:hypothetical protein